MQTLLFFFSFFFQKCLVIEKYWAYLYSCHLSYTNWACSKQAAQVSKCYTWLGSWDSLIKKHNSSWIAPFYNSSIFTLHWGEQGVFRLMANWNRGSQQRAFTWLPRAQTGRVWKPWKLCKHQNKTPNPFNYCWSDIPKASVNLHLDIMVLIFFSNILILSKFSLQSEWKGVSFQPSIGRLCGILKPKREQGQVEVYKPLWQWLSKTHTKQNKWSFPKGKIAV